MGLSQILSHADSEKHKTNINNLKGQTVFKSVRQASVCASASVASSSEELPATQSVAETATDVVLVGPKFQHGKAWVPSHDDKVKKAEILLALKLVSSNYSFSSFSGIGDVCKTAFPDSGIAQHMQLSRTKVSYLVIHGLAPYFRTHFIKDLKNEIGYLTIYFDERIFLLVVFFIVDHPSVLLYSGQSGRGKAVSVSTLHRPLIRFPR